METPNHRITRSKTASPSGETIPESNTSSHRRLTFSTPTKDAKTKETTKIKPCKTDCTKEIEEKSQTENIHYTDSTRLGAMSSSRTYSPLHPKMDHVRTVIYLTRLLLPSKFGKASTLAWD
ncbi:hypothetical protein Fot_41208 [Forsythia ovata]|uniref:Uncharacterized protein n=1 Tax=Forsythia ovata TaxID=205694 RepID=A0ABD1RIP0_9LAMI